MTFGSGDERARGQPAETAEGWTRTVPFSERTVFRPGAGGGRGAAGRAGALDAALSRLGLCPPAERRPVLVVSGGADEIGPGPGDQPPGDQPGPGPGDQAGLRDGAGPAGSAGQRVPRQAATVLGAAVAAARELSGAILIDDGGGSVAAAASAADDAGGTGSPPTVLSVVSRHRAVGRGTPGDEEQEHTRVIEVDVAEGDTAAAWKPAVAATLAEGAPVVTVLAGGAAAARAEVLSAVRCGIPVFVLAWSGGLARQLGERRQRLHRPGRARLPHRSRRDGGSSLPTADRKAEEGTRGGPEAAAQSQSESEEVHEIVRHGDLRVLSERDAGALSRRLTWELQDEPVLKAAWQTFATYDRLATRLRRAFQRLQAVILGLGVFATLLALIDAEIGGRKLHWVVVAVPVAVSVLIAWSSRHARGPRWIALRAAAEDVKSEIYRHRALEGAAAPAEGSGRMAAERRRRMLKWLGDIEGRLVRTNAATAPLTPYDGPLPPPMAGSGCADDGLSPLTAAQYVGIRLGDQIAYYHSRVRHLHRLRSALEALAICAGAAGTLLAAVQVDPWIGLTTGVSTAALAALGYVQADANIMAYNRTAGDLEVLRQSWEARAAEEQEASSVVALVMKTEAVLRRERARWVHQMSEVLQELKDRQDLEPKKRPAPHDGSEGAP
ncbi:hypothetical protein B7P34_02085 [Streptosporangium nondiastaticum]|uniref:SMODS and SLOG-associating 2TM effector domain-containing protein n=1 Tax=Streptosporangium nondiastaticum TaxID=35764 RepID=A0A9X7JV20_9ACTN|nr:DUF4231 domain-containing protein [Streptosporangium nondiastaticum]PSJ30372.1 hypothetical protein B7P34_02085 [Streptosporangium nondiastaticum]